MPMANPLPATPRLDVPSPSFEPAEGSPVHAMHVALQQAWQADHAALGARDVKALCPGRLALIAALGLAAWVPVMAVASAVLA